MDAGKKLVKPPAPPSLTVPIPGGIMSRLERFAHSFQAIYPAAQALVTTNFVPQAYQGRPDQAAAAILYGDELGMTPMVALRSIHLINGTPALTAVAMRGLVQSKGHLIWVEESTATRAVVRGRRAGDDQVETSTWTIDRAKALGLTNRDNWRQQPIAMLIARATAECARLIAADVLMGMEYAVEEANDMPLEIPDAPPKRGTRTIKRRPLPAKDAQPDEPDTDEPDEPEPEPAEAQADEIEPAPDADEPF